MTPTVLTPGRARTRALLRIAALLGVVLLGAAVGGVAVTLQPGFFSRFHEVESRHTTLNASSHRGIPCISCHAGATGAFGFEAAAVGDFYGSLLDTATLHFTVFRAPTREACLSCHRYAWSDEASRTAKVPHPAHLRVASETRDCVSCHKWTSHEEVYQAKHTTMPFSGVCASFPCHTGTKQTGDCVNCHHVLQEGDGGWIAKHPATVRASGPGACLESCHKPEQCDECHTTGKVTSLPSSIATAGVSAVEAKHVAPDWLSTHGTVALAEPTVCSTCHISNGECLDCHSQRPVFHGPRNTWLTRHKDFAKDTRRCLTCHQQPWCDSCHAQFKEK